MGVPVEQCEPVGVAEPYLAFASLALEPGNRMKPTAAFDQGVATERAFKGHFDSKQAG